MIKCTTQPRLHLHHECFTGDVTRRNCHRSLGGQRARMLREVRLPCSPDFERPLIVEQLPEIMQSQVL